jgi:hypothetical protein
MMPNAKEMIVTPRGRWCSMECLSEWLQANQEKERKKRLARIERTHKDQKRVVKKNDIKRQHRLTQIAFNRMRVLEEKLWFKERGLEPTCISCGKPNMDWCCGHFKTRKAQGNLRYDRKNTFLQCNYYCNRNLSGNIEGNKTTRGYKVGLVERFGEQEGKAIISYCESRTEAKKWTCDELESMRKEFNAKIRELQ